MMAHSTIASGGLWLLALLAVAPAQAATTCTASMTDLLFDKIDVDTSTYATASLSVTCHTTALSVLGNTKVRMCLHVGRPTSPRSMPNALNDMLSFQMYQDATYATVWGSRFGASPANLPVQLDFDYAVPLIVGGSETKVITLYGRVPAQATAAIGQYSQSYAANHTILEFRYNTSLILAASYPASCTAGGTAGIESTFPFEVRGDVDPLCHFSAVSDLDFGSLAGPIAGTHDSTSTITMRCRNRTAWTLGLDNGLNFSGGTRRMRLGTTAEYVDYQLHRNPGRNAAWGETIGVDTTGGTGNGLAQAHEVYGRVPGGQNVPAGDYSDQVRVTVTY